MPRLSYILAVGVAAAALASCARSGLEVASPPAQNQPPELAAEPSAQIPFETPPVQSAPPEPAVELAERAWTERPENEFVVTGTRIRRPDISSTTPVTVVSNEAFIAPSYAPVTPVRQGNHNAQEPGRDRFTSVAQNGFMVSAEAPVSTFSIDVDTASYSFVRASLNRGMLPQQAAVRTEEMLNYFPYDYSAPRSADAPFSSDIAVFPSPWNAGRKLVRIGIQGYAIERAERPRANLVFLIDTSGSMSAANKLPLVQQSLSMLLDQLRPDDSVAIVTYAGSAGTLLEPTPASQREVISAAIDRLGAGGSTAGAEGIRQAYALAERNFDRDGVNRVILATDGDFNVGITDPEALKSFVERERGKGVFLSVLGFGMGNYNDALMQVLAQNGNGAAAYIDTIAEAQKTLVEESTSTLFPIAKDVKIQVEFNPATVAEYRLVGYETRMLAREDFDNDQVDAGEVGSGQSVTALYEIVPVGGARSIGDLRYSRPLGLGHIWSGSGNGSEYGFVKIRYKLPNSERSRLISTPINRRSEVRRFADAPRDARFAAGVAAFAELLRGGRYTGTMRYEDILGIVSEARGEHRPLRLNHAAAAPFRTEGGDRLYV